MNSFKVNTSGRMGFRQQLAITFVIGILLSALISSFTISYLSGKSIRDRFIYEGFQTANTFATQSKLALLYQSPENVNEYAEAILNSPDIIAVGVYDTNHRALMELGEKNRLRNIGNEIPASTIMARDSRKQWQFASPVFTSPAQAEDSPFTVNPSKPELLGYIQLVMSKQTLQSLTGDLLKTNILVSASLAGILLAVLLLITSRVTKPVNRLAETMHRATTGESKIRSNIEGPRDITAMQSAFNKMMDALEAREIELKTARDSALETARIKGEFAATVSHELRTPLNGVLGMLELLGGMGLNKKQADYLDVAKSSGESLLSLVNDILDFSRNDSGSIELSNENVDLISLLDEIIELSGPQANKKGIDLGYIIEKDVPSVITGDRARLHQILVNLIGNAVKFTDTGEVSVKIDTFEGKGSSTELLFEVSDSGIGISEEAHQRIFEPFLQADGSTTRRYGGTGLGLAICKQLIEFMDGELGVKSTPGIGSTFWLRLPLHEMENIQVNNSMCERLSGKSVLIVDDSSVVRDQVRNICERLSMRSMTAETIKEMENIIGVRDKRSSSFDFILIDSELSSAYGQPLSDTIDSISRHNNSRIIFMERKDANISDQKPDYISIAARKPITSAALKSILLEALNGVSEGIAPSKEAVAANDSTPVYGTSDINVLVVEDNRSNQIVVSGMLDRLGYSSSVMSNGHDAIEAVHSNAFDLILMDCNMPGIDGYETTRRIRSIDNDRAHIPIIAMTANVQDGEIKKCLESGMNDYLSKPLKLEVLNKKLDTWIQHTTSQEIDSIDTDSRNVDPAQSISQSIDKEFFQELKATIGHAFPNMLRVFIEDLPGYLNNIENAIRDNNFDEVPNIAHTIKGSASNIGATRMADISRHIEAAARNMDIKTVRMLHNSAVAESHVLTALLHNELEGKPLEDSGTGRVNTAHILVVDDDRSTRFAFRNVLAEEGYQILEAENGIEAIDMCSAHMPDLVLMDGKMPVLDGFKACQKLKQNPDTAKIPVLIITGLEDEDSIEKAFSVGATDYIPKPVNFSVLRKRISHLMHASRAERHMHRLAYSDALTGLPNRVRFTNHLNNLLISNREKGKPLSVMFIDVDRFKLINDTLGHDAGDMILKIVAERLHHCVRDGDLVARLGGDEFTIVLNDVGSKQILTSIADKICSAFSKPVTFLDHEIFITLSIGISMYPFDASDMATLMKHADTAMFNAKHYRNDYRFFEYGMEADAAKRLKLGNDLRRAVERDELTIYYQPQIESRTGNVIGVEALVRWIHPERGIVPPSDFIPLAEDTGLIIQIGNQVLHKSCRQLMEWKQRGYPPLRMAVNLSVRQIEKYEIIDTVAKTLQETGVSPEYLELEITESVIMEHAEDMISIFRKLKDMGLHLAIDDFGTGYSSLAYLKRFPVDILKIDRSFVQDIPSDHEDIAIITGVIAMARGLGLSVIAEGVENNDQERFLRESGCDYMQGFYFSEPLTPDDFERRFMSRQNNHHVSSAENVTLLKPNKPG